MMQSVDELLGQIRPVTGPEAAPPDDSPSWTGPILAFMAFGIIALFLWLRRRRPPPSPVDEALAALDRLSQTPTEAALAQFDQTARRFLERTTSIPATNLTNAEIFAQLDPPTRRSWQPILELLQPGRFSPRPLSENQWHALIQQVRPLIRSAQADFSGPVDRRI